MCQGFTLQIHLITMSLSWKSIVESDHAIFTVKGLGTTGSQVYSPRSRFLLQLLYSTNHFTLFLQLVWKSWEKMDKVIYVF